MTVAAILRQPAGRPLIIHLRQGAESDPGPFRMSKLNEAEGLLQNGAMYPRRLGLRRQDGTLDLVGVKHAGFALYHEDGPFFHFDLDGRWQRIMLGATHFLKHLDNSVEAIDRNREAGEMVLQRRACSYAEVAELDQLARQSALERLQALSKNLYTEEPPPPPGRLLVTQELRTRLESVVAWDAAAWFRHRELYVATYGPLGLIPPDARRALVLQATDELGHHRSPDQFRQHARDARRLLGGRLAQYRSVYLAGDAAFRAPVAKIEEWLQATNEVLGVTDAKGPPRPGWLRESEPRIDSIQGLIVNLESPFPTPESWRRFSAMHLGRITLAPKPDTAPSDLLQAVADLKHASIAVSILLEASDFPAELTNSSLGPGDQVFLIGQNRSSKSEALDTWRRERGVKVLGYSTSKQG